MKKNWVSRYVTTGLAITGLCMAAGCVTTDTVSSRLPQLEENINAAKAVDAGIYAPIPLKSAETRLDSAKAAIAANDMVSANRYVDEAMADADYARAKAPTEKAGNDAGKLRTDIQAVRNEIKKMPAAK